MGKHDKLLEQVIIEVRGGVADVVSNTAGCDVIIRDYDVEGCDEDQLLENENGDQYLEGNY